MASRPVVVITDSDFGDDEVESHVLEPTFELRRASARTASEVIEVARDAVALLVQWAAITATVFDALPALRVVVRYGIGLDNIDLNAADRHGVLVRNVDDYCVNEVAEHAAAAIAGASRRQVQYNAAVKAGKWGPDCAPSPLEASEDPVGVAGYGRIGSVLAAKIKAAGHPVIVWDPYASDRIERDRFDEAPDLRTLAANVNHLSLHLPLSPATTGLVDASVLAALGSFGHLVNCSRGALCDEVAVLAWLESNEFATASLDVFVHEPPHGPSWNLAGHPRVISSPHVAYLSTRSLLRLRRSAAEQVLDALLVRPTGAREAPK